jgi:hypothetical protein
LSGTSGMTWWVAVLIAWPLVGLGVAYLFGLLIGGMQSPESTDDQPPSGGHVGPKKRVKRSPRAGAKQVERKHRAGHPFPKGHRYMTPYGPIARRPIAPSSPAGVGQADPVISFWGHPRG